MARLVAADALVRTTLSLGDSSLRAVYVATTLRGWPIPIAARTLDARVREGFEQAESHVVAGSARNRHRGRTERRGDGRSPSAAAGGGCGRRRCLRSAD